MGIFSKTADFLKERLGKTRSKIASSLSTVLSLGRKIDDDLLDELEETLIRDDIGVETTEKLISELRDAYRARKISAPRRSFRSSRRPSRATGPIRTGNCTWPPAARP